MAFNRTLQHFTSSQELATVWASGQSYILNQVVLYNYSLYVALIDHTSSISFPNDFSDGKWAILGGAGSSTDRMLNVYSVNTTITNLDSVVLVDATSGPVTITLPDSISGKYFDIKKIDTSANVVTILHPTQTIDGDPSVTLDFAYSSLTIIGDGSDFILI
jgi:hypothetical protein